jgi:hypothetical protein
MSSASSGMRPPHARVAIVRDGTHHVPKGFGLARKSLSIPRRFGGIDPGLYDVMIVLCPSPGPH